MSSIIVSAEVKFETITTLSFGVSFLISFIKAPSTLTFPESSRPSLLAIGRPGYSLFLSNDGCEHNFRRLISTLRASAVAF